MNIDLLNRIDDAIKQNFSIVYYDHIPEDQDFTRVFVTWKVTNDSNVSTFEQKNIIRNYTLNVYLNYPTIKAIGETAKQVQSSIYQIEGLNAGIRHIKLDSEDLVFNPELNIYTVVQNYNIQYS